MVSISSPSFQTGGVSLGDQPGMDNERRHLLHEREEEEFEFEAEDKLEFTVIRTPVVIFLQIVLSVCLELEVFLLPLLWKSNSDFIFSQFSIVLLSHAALWFLFLFSDRFIRYEHNISRCKGYLEFYMQTRGIKRAPYAIVSTGNALLLVLIVLWEDLNKYFTHEGRGATEHTRTITLQVLISLEFVALMITLTKYFVRTLKFNRQKAKPDAFEQDGSRTALYGSLEVGARDDNTQQELLEKQAEMVRYLKDHNRQLAKQVLQLATSIQRSGNTPGPEDQIAPPFVLSDPPRRS